MTRIALFAASYGIPALVGAEVLSEFVLIASAIAIYMKSVLEGHDEGAARFGIRSDKADAFQKMSGDQFRAVNMAIAISGLMRLALASGIYFAFAWLAT